MKFDLQKLLIVTSVILAMISVGTYVYIHTKYIGTNTGSGFRLLVILTLGVALVTFLSSFVDTKSSTKKQARNVSLTILVPVLLFFLALAVLGLMLSRSLNF